MIHIQEKYEDGVRINKYKFKKKKTTILNIEMLRQVFTVSYNCLPYHRFRKVSDSLEKHLILHNLN